MSESTLAEAPAPVVGDRANSPADLVLVRLLVAPKGLALKKLRDDLAPLFRTPPSVDRIAAVTTELRGEGFVTTRGQRLTDAGRAAALQFLGVESLPPRSNWGTVKARYILPRVLGLTPGHQATAKADQLAALLLKRKLGLPVGTGATLNAVLEAIACRELGYPDHTELVKLKPLLLAKAVGSDEPLTLEKVRKVVPAVLLGANPGKRGALCDAALAGWLDGGVNEPEPGPQPPLPAAEEPFDLEAFANTVRSEARVCPTGRFGDNKVFINHVWDRLKDERQFAPLGLAGFKQRLLEAHRRELLTLSRADLVQLMDPADVRESEIAYLNATFHFILVEGS